MFSEVQDFGKITDQLEESMKYNSNQERRKERSQHVTWKR